MSWNRIRGHAAVVRLFQTAWQRGRLGQAYLFVGPEGIGKRTFARELARTLLCEQPSEGFAACGQCTACQLVDAQTHPDLFQLARPQDAQELSIDLIRELVAQLALKPARGRRKIAILDDADDLTIEASNCFLKPLEEPPPGSLLILIGTSAERQLTTIRSRCQLVSFAPLSLTDLTAILTELGVGKDGGMARIVRCCGGSVRLAKALDDPELWQFRQTLLDAIAVPTPDATKISEMWMQFVEAAGKESAAQRQRSSLVLRLLLGLIETAWKIAIGAAPVIESSREAEQLHGLAQHWGAEKLLRFLDRCLDADLQNDRKVQLVLIVEALLDTLAREASPPMLRKSG